MDKHKEYILHLVQNENVDPSFLLDTTRRILEDYVESITDSTLIPVLYNSQFGGFCFSERFERRLGELNCTHDIYLDLKSRTTLYYLIVDQFAKELLCDPECKKKFLVEYMAHMYKEYVVRSYKMFKKEKDINIDRIQVENEAKKQKRLEIVKSYLAKGEFGAKNSPDNFSHILCEVNFLKHCLENSTKSYAENVLKKIEQSMDSEYMYEYILKNFDIQNMIWVDPVKNARCNINADIFEKVKIDVALKEASGEYCNLKVFWIPKNKHYDINDYDGKEYVHVGSVLKSDIV